MKLSDADLRAEVLKPMLELNASELIQYAIARKAFPSVIDSINDLLTKDNTLSATELDRVKQDAESLAYEMYLNESSRASFPQLKTDEKKVAVREVIRLMNEYNRKAKIEENLTRSINKIQTRLDALPSLSESEEKENIVLLQKLKTEIKALREESKQIQANQESRDRIPTDENGRAKNESPLAIFLMLGIFVTLPLLLIPLTTAIISMIVASWVPLVCYVIYSGVDAYRASVESDTLVENINRIAEIEANPVYKKGYDNDKLQERQGKLANNAEEMKEIMTKAETVAQKHFTSLHTNLFEPTNIALSADKPDLAAKPAGPNH